MYVYDRPLCPGPASPEDGQTEPFAGREILLRSLVEGFHKRRSYLLCAGPKMGKTSMLNKIRRHIFETWQRSPRAPKIVPVPVDLAALSTQTAEGLTAFLYQAIITAISVPHVAGDCQIKPPIWKLGRGEDAWAYLRQNLNTLWKQLRGTQAWCTYGLLIDGGELMVKRPLDDVLWGFAGFLKQEPYNDAAPGGCIIACGRGVRELLFDVDSPLKFARPLFLSVLNEGDATSLVRAGIDVNDFDDEALDSLLITTGRHPYVLQRVCAALFEQGDGATLEGAIESAAPDILDLFSEIWEAFDMDRGVTYRGAYAAPEHALMQLLVETEAGTNIRSAEKELGIKPLKEFSEFLNYVGVVEEVLIVHERRVRAHFDLFNTWYSDHIME